MGDQNHDTVLAARLASAEMLLMHLERQLAELNEVVLEQAEKISTLERQIRRLQAPPEDELGDEEPLERE
jgi:uncharacterized coiled-coil protein SlyX